MLRRREAVATCTGERVASRTGTRETADWHPRESRVRPRAGKACDQTEGWCFGAHVGQLATGGIRITKDRDVQALEVRAGMPCVGHTSRDAAGLSSTNSNRVKVARTSVENGPRSLYYQTEAEIQPLLL